jgi:hypothetical protein
MSNPQDEQGRPENTPYEQPSEPAREQQAGQQHAPPAGQEYTQGAGQQYGQQYGQPAPYDQQYGQQYGQQTGQQYGQQYGQPFGQQSPTATPAPYEQSGYGQQPGYPQSYDQQYADQQYAAQQYPQQYGQQPAYAQQYAQPPAYGQYAQYAGGVPPRPGGITLAAVFGFIFGALGVLSTVALFVIGAVAGGSASSADNAIPGLGTIAGAAAGVLIFFGLLALAWTVLMIWGSAWALSGRSRVLLLVGGSISVFTTGISFFASLGDNNSNAGGIIVVLVFFLMAITIVVLLARRQAGEFYAAHRARRNGR